MRDVQTSTRCESNGPLFTAVTLVKMQKVTLSMDASPPRASTQVPSREDGSLVSLETVFSLVKFFHSLFRSKLFRIVSGLQ